MENIKLPLNILIDSHTISGDQIKKLESYHSIGYLNIYHTINPYYRNHLIMGDKFKGFVKSIRVLYEDHGIIDDCNTFESEQYCSEYCNEIKINKRIMNLINIFLSLFYDRLSSSILISDSKIIHEKRKRILEEFKYTPYNILSMKDACLFIDLVFKSRGNYFNYPFKTIDLYQYFELSLVSKIKHLIKLRILMDLKGRMQIFSDEVIDHFFTLLDRLISLLYSVDEIGKLNYTYVWQETNSITFLTNYFFCHWVILFEGIFDSLAWLSKNLYNLKTKSNTDISLHKRDFRKRIENDNSILYKHLQNNDNLLRLVKVLRDSIAHRVRPFTFPFFEYSDNYPRKTLYADAPLLDDIIRFIRGKAHNNAAWGLHEDYGHKYLVPYEFVIPATKELMNFTAKYLELLIDYETHYQTLPEAELKKYGKNIDLNLKKRCQKAEIFKSYQLGF